MAGVVMPPAESTFFVGSYAPAAEPGIHAFVLDEAKAELRRQHALAGVSNPSFLALHPRGDHLYAVSETGVASDGIGGAVHAFRVDRADGSIDLCALNDQSSGGDHPCHLSIASDGRWLAVSNYGTGSVAVFPLMQDGSLGPTASSVQHAGSGPNAKRQEGPHVHASVFTPDGRHLIVADLGIDRLVVYAFDAETGALALHDEVATTPGAGPRSLVFHRDRRHVLVANELDSTLTLHEWHASSGSLRPLQTMSNVPPGAPENAVGEVDISHSGKHAYASNRGHDSLAVHAFTAVNRLSPAVVRTSGGQWPRSFALAPGGRHVVVANRHSNSIAVLPLLAEGADIGEPSAWAEVSQPSCVVFG